MDVNICPDCTEGKHNACVDQAWDAKREEIVPCSCSHASHQR